MELVSLISPTYFKTYNHLSLIQHAYSVIPRPNIQKIKVVICGYNALCLQVGPQRMWFGRQMLLWLQTFIIKLVFLKNKVTFLFNNHCCTVGQKKRNTPIYFNTNYHIEMKLVPIIMEQCLLQFDALKFFFGLRLHERSLPNFNFFNVNPQIFQRNRKVHR